MARGQRPWFARLLISNALFFIVRSGLDYNEEERGVQPVYLRCSQGKVTWKYPRGGLRVVLRHGTQGKEFKGCLRAGQHFRGVRIYLEGHRRLHLLHSPDDGRHPELPRCFASRRGQAALYVEAEPVSNSVLLKRNVVEFTYDLQLKSSRAAYGDDDPQEGE